MTKIFKVGKISWIGFLIAFFLMFFAASFTHAQDVNQAASKYNVTFPVEQLGGCEDYAACRTYCEDPVNSTACIAFAKEKGFYKQDPISTRKDAIIAAAKAQLGCDSESSCKTFCEQEENRARCASFAQSQNLSGGYTQNPNSAPIIQKAQEVLGCNSESSCRAICESEENREKCTNFAQEVGLRGGEERKGPGGCNSPETCSAFCSDPLNFNECSKFGPPPGSSGPNQAGFKGPGGCDSEQSCRQFCEQNPAQCKIISIGAAGLIDDPKKAAEEYQKFCQSNPTQCQNRQGNVFSDLNARVEFEKFCSVNPDKCAAKTHFKGEAGLGGYSLPKKTGEYVNPGEYCKTNPDQCPRYNPQEMCQRSPSCKWTNNSCQCEFSQPQSSTQPGVGAPTGGSKSPTQPCPNVVCSAGLSPDPTKSCACTRPPYPGGNPTGGYQGSYPGGMSFDQQEAQCRAGGGTCSNDRSKGFCGCQGYKGTSGSTTTTNTNTTPTTTNTGGSTAETACKGAGGTWMGSYCQMPNSNTPTTYSGNMSRESQEAGCKACNGTCNWNGDFCNCNCQNTTPSSDTPPPTNQTQPQPAPEQTQQPTPTPTVQGATTVRSLFDRILDIFR